MFSRSRLGGADWPLVISSLCLFTLGIIIISTTGERGRSDAPWQLLYGALGVGAFVLAARFDYRLIQRYTPGLYVLMIVALVLVHVAGTEVLGARRWIDFGVFQFQPSELAKIIFIVILAKYFSGLSGRPSLREILRSGVYLLLPLSLVVTQPDLGTALVFVAIWAVFLVAARIKAVHLALLAAAGTIGAPLIWQSLKPYQQSRLLTFLDPDRDPLGAGYNVTQSQIAVGSGGLWGRGLGHGTQSNLNFLPVQHTDFIFAALAEELGLAGVLLLFLLYGLLFARTIGAVSRARDLFGMYLAVGITAMLLFHVLVNVGMNVGLMPVTGIPLPLVSYGGTSVIMTFASLGLIQSVLRRSRTS